MCIVCGCGDASGPAHGHDHGHASEGGELLHYGEGPARVSVPGMSQERTIRLEQSVLAANDRLAAQNRQHFGAHRVLALNLVSSPGSGKTTLLVETLRRLREGDPHLGLGVVEGDQQTSFDAERVRATGVPAVQVNTGKGCHLDAQMVGTAFDRLAFPATGGVLFIENVGNLVCPALWDLGEAAKVAVLSVTEGDEKPLKYPDMFAAASLMLLNKIDLLPHVQFDVEKAVAFARRVNPRIQVLRLSATTGAGFEGWLSWIAHELAHARHETHHHHDGHDHDHDHDHGHGHGHPPADAAEAEVKALRARVAELEARLGASR
ncbi:MAG TPA: hydrogenase nickel incorporation protein HypB [Burkholderiaceae bacterium]|nr:hydrogenase nickel incorporation protein HypB [Burkholderiaceae bacterium]